MTDDADRQVREVLTEAYAAWAAKGAVLLAGQAEPDAASRALETWVLSRQDGAWRVQAFHNCPEQGNRDAQ